MPRVLILDDEPGIQRVVARTFRRDPSMVIVPASSNSEARAVLAEQPIDAIIEDVNHPGGGLAFLDEVARDHPRLPVIVSSGACHPGLALARGAQASLSKPWDSTSLVSLVERALAFRAELLAKALTPLRAHGVPFPAELVGGDPEIRDVQVRLAKLARGEQPIAIEAAGERCARRIAALIHGASPRAGGPLVVAGRLEDDRIIGPGAITRAQGGTLVVRDPEHLREAELIACRCASAGVRLILVDEVGGALEDLDVRLPRLSQRSELDHQQILDRIDTEPADEALPAHEAWARPDRRFDTIREAREWMRARLTPPRGG